ALHDLSVSSTTHSGTTRLAAGTIDATGAVTFGQDVVLLADTAITSGGELTFERRIDSDATARDLTITTSNMSDARFFGRVGATSALDTLSVTGDGTTFLFGTDYSGAALTFGEDVALGANVTVTGTSSVSFGGRVNARNAENHDLV